MVQQVMIDTTLAKICEEIQAICQDLAEIKRMVWKIPTIYQWIYIQTTLIVVIFASAFGVLKLIGPH